MNLGLGSILAVSIQPTKGKVNWGNLDVTPIRKKHNTDGMTGEMLKYRDVVVWTGCGEPILHRKVERCWKNRKEPIL